MVPTTKSADLASARDKKPPGIKNNGKRNTKPKMAIELNLYCIIIHILTYKIDPLDVDFSYPTGRFYVDTYKPNSVPILHTEGVAKLSTLP